MTPTKLSDSDKHEILGLYRHSEENTITLAKRYGVSSSTVRRILQSALSEAEYEALVQQKQKRLPHSQSVISSPMVADVDQVPELDLPETVYPASSDLIPHSKLIRKRSIGKPESLGVDVPAFIPQGLPVSDLPEDDAAEFVDDDYSDGVSNLEEMLGDEGPLEAEEFRDFDDEDDEDDDDDLEDDFDSEDLDDDDFEGMANTRPGLSIQLRSKTLVQVLPLSEASLPKICYLVVDRAGELITRPLKAFGELGQIPRSEIREKTLPVFDNHRVARRFSTRNQRVFKVPDGRLLQKTAPYLQAKGITRLLIDGQVYSL
jgi:transposase-like protein